MQVSIQYEKTLPIRDIYRNRENQPELFPSIKNSRLCQLWQRAAQKAEGEKKHKLKNCLIKLI